jgi:hypothetical protein
MFRAYSFVLAVVLCTFGWSTAHAAPKGPLGGSLSKTMKGGWLLKDGAIHLNRPIKTALPFNGAYEKDKIKLPSLTGVVTFFGLPSLTYLTFKNWHSGDHRKDAERDGAH